MRTTLIASAACFLAMPCVAAPKLFPAAGARNVNPDTQLVLTFAAPPKVGTSGRVQILDAADNSVVDILDLSIPASPVPDGRPKSATGETKSPAPPKPAGPDNPDFQAVQVGGAWFHFFPVTAKGNAATIHPHNGALKYGRTYIVRLDPQVLTTADGQPLEATKSWTFTTKAAPPKAGVDRVVVSADGKGDFSTVQGAIDFAPQVSAKPLTIFIRNGDYQEIVYLKGKSNLTLRGESREGVVVHYPNNSAFNRIRPAFTVTEANDIQLSTFTIRNDFIGQAEALLLRGERNIVDRMTLNGSGDAFTTYGSIYMVDSTLTGDGDTILGYAALYCLRCTIKSVGPFTWTRTPKGRHGNVFVDSKLIYVDKPLPWSITAANPEGRKTEGTFGRLPRNGPASSPMANFPYAEFVLIDSKTDGVPPEGWGAVEDRATFDWSNLRLFEFNTRDLAGKPIDLSKRHPAMRALTLPTDAQTVAEYRRPEFVLGGWKPVVR
uniref:pectinesterase family protein n=1 Tax=uncultured Caulobacter sp. TaxID=158749 RepID=UPI0025E8E470|nr:pectinesterase family protein [uncultured Caulobacter sp.]